MNRREALKLALAAAAAPVIGACQRQDKPMIMPTALMPSIFLAHGSPFLLDDAPWMTELGQWARAMPRPRAVLMISAHWVNKPVTLGATETVPLVYDFYGFPQRYYQVGYPAPGAPRLARRVQEVLEDQEPVAHDVQRGLDHGAYIPLLGMYPSADVPVLQMSIPTMDPAALIALGRSLAPLRSEGVLIIGSGFLTHNLRQMDMAPGALPPAWASEFDAWCHEALIKRDVDALVDYRRKAPGVTMALPTHEHFVPVLVSLGASLDRSEQATFPITGFRYGSATRRSVQFG